MQSTASRTLSVRSIVITGILAAVAILLGATRLGFIPVPNPSGNATIMHVPAIIAGIIAGPISGLIVGGIFGLYSFLSATTPFFKDPLVAILPRLFIGVTAYFAYASLRGINRNTGYVLAGILGVLVATFLVISFQNIPPVDSASIIYPPLAPDAPEGARSLVNLQGMAAVRAYQFIAIAVGAIGIAVVVALLRFVQRDEIEMLAVSTAAIVGTLTNTVLVVAMLIIRNWFPAGVIIPAVLPQAFAEIVIAVIVTVAVVAGYKQMDSGKGGSSI
jgi:uncharacterized membrane protein